MNPQFIHLKLHSTYSLSSGAIKIPDIISLCKKYHMPAIAITDNGNLFGCLEFSSSAKKEGIKPLIGCILNIDTLDQKLSFYVQNKTGLNNLFELCSKSFLNRKPDEGNFVTEAEVTEHADGLICLTSGYEGLVGKALLDSNIDLAEKKLLWLKELFGDRLYIDIARHGQPQEEKTEEQFINFAYKHNIPLVAVNDIYYADDGMYEAHDALMCIAHGKYLVEENRPKSNPNYYFKSPRSMLKLFADLPEAVENTVIIAQRCNAFVEEMAPLLPKCPNESGLTESEELIRLSEIGLEKRLQDEVLVNIKDESEIQRIRKEYFDRLHFEAEVITKMDFPGYFLIVSDFIRWSKRNDIPVGPGRGSGAGSVIAWSLEITDLDPIRFGLLFERFLNPERISMPDFDIDFCQERRDEVIEYVKNRYGDDKVAQIITFGKLQARAVVRDVGRVLQIPYGKVDRISKMIPFNPVNPVNLEQAVEMEPLLRAARKEDEQIAKLIDIALKLEGLNRHVSTHAAGIVIGDRKLTELVPLYRDAKSTMAVAQYSMKYCEAAGLVKFDFLGLKTLTVIAHTLKLLSKRNIHIDITKIPLDDPKTYEMLAEGKSVGVFQFESGGMRDALRKLKPDAIEDLIALGALYRPGPMDNIPTYIARKHGLEEPDYIHPKLESVLKETFGVIIYQEQVMEIAKILGGYTLGAADLLRRAMGKKIKEEMDAQRELFINGAIQHNNVPKARASEIFDLVAKFAGYGFNKSHAAAYAMISYQTAYLKANYPVEFITSLMNLDTGDTDKLAIFSQEAKSCGITILPPDVNKSDAHFIPELLEDQTQAIRFALGAIKNVGIVAMSDLIKERNEKGQFAELRDVFTRNSSKIIGKRSAENLVRAGAFDSLEPNRHRVFAALEMLLKCSNNSDEEKDKNQFSLFSEEVSKPIRTFNLPEVSDWQGLQKLHEEFEAFGFYLNSHPLDSYEFILHKLNVHSYDYVNDKLPNGISNIKIAAIIISTRSRSSLRGRYLTATLSDITSIFELNIFDDQILANSEELLASRAPVILDAEVRKDEGGVRLTAKNIISLEDYLKSLHLQVKLRINHKNEVSKFASLIHQKGTVRLTLIINKDSQEIEIDTGAFIELTEHNMDLIMGHEAELVF